VAKSDIESIGEAILRASKAENTEVIIMKEESGLTRYANSYIHQNVGIHDIQIGVRVRFGKKCGVAWGNGGEREKLVELVRQAEKIANVTPEDPDLPDLPQPIEVKESDAYVDSTANTTPERRANAIRDVIEIMKPFRAYGAFTTGVVEVLYLNSQGHSAYHVSTDAHLTVNGIQDLCRGWAQASSRDVNEINHEEVARKAREKAELSREPIEIEPGEYPVILEELAVAELLFFMGFFGFSAKTYQEGRSFLIGKLNKKIFDEKLSLYDDPFYPSGFPMSFDFEGIPKKKLTLIERGVPRTLVYDLKTAKKEGKISTGHAAIPFTSSPYPMHMVMMEGEDTLDKLIEETERGILITRLHYTNVLEPMTLTITGMTRDGTFLIEDGKIKKGIKNMRFTQSIVDALSRIDGITKKKMLVGDTNYYGIRFPLGVVVPSIKLPSFRFTGKTEF